MTAAATTLTEDRWLAAVMDRPAFRVEFRGVGDQAADVDAIAGHIRQQQRAFYYSKVDVNRIDVARRLGALGFFVADTNVCLRLDRPTSVAFDFPGVSVGDVAASDAALVLEVAGSAFRYTRFHQDPFIGADLAHAIKRAWCSSYLNGQRGDRLFVAKVDGRVAGFLAALTVDPGGNRAIIDLIGVAPAFQRRRVGSALTAAFIAHYRDRASMLQVGTQVANVASIRLYERFGFSLVSSEYVLHLHAEAGHARR